MTEELAMAAGTDATDALDTAKRLRGITEELTGRFLERDDVVRTLIVAMLAGQHSLVLGPPGTAKSELARELTGRIEGANLWEILLSKFTAPTRMFGPIDVAALSPGRVPPGLRRPCDDGAHRVHRRDFQVLHGRAQRDLGSAERTALPPGERRRADPVPPDQRHHRDQRTALRGRVRCRDLRPAAGAYGGRATWPIRATSPRLIRSAVADGAARRGPRSTWRRCSTR